MKRFLAFFLVVLMLTPACFASFTGVDDGFQEAETCYVEAESDTAFSQWEPAELLEDPVVSSEKVYTEEQLETMRQLNLASSSNSTRATWTYLPGYIVYNQTDRYNCGPACIQAALKYINGSTPNQASIASSCGTDSSGTDMGVITRYLNAYQNRNNYYLELWAGSGTLGTILYEGVAVINAPPIIGLSFSSNEGWYYSTSEHVMSVYGARDDWGRFALADPWIGYPNSGLAGSGIGWSYAMDLDKIFDAYNNIRIGVIY